MFLLLLHGKKFWSYVTWPLLLTFLEKLIQSYRAKKEVELIEARSLPSDVLTIKFKVKDGSKFRYRAGQYIYINCPDVSVKEWHPFTLSSSPEDDFLSCHIRCSKRLDWCFPFRQAINPGDAKIRRFDRRKTSSNSSKRKHDSARKAAKVSPVEGSSEYSQPIIRID